MTACLLAMPAAAATPGAAAARPPSQAGMASPPAKPGKARKATAQRQRLKSKASALALASSTAETINAAQLHMASRVLTGSADCEFDQRVSVLPLDSQPGWFTVAHKNMRYRMLPQETQTGAVRLEDKASGMVWLQIPSKSMLMNARLGQRLVDSCLHADQRAAVLADAGAPASAANSLGIVVPSGALAAAPGPSAPITGGPTALPTIAAGLLPPGAPSVLAPAGPRFDTAAADGAG